MDRNIYDYSNFFSAGKFFAYLNEKAPCCMVEVEPPSAWYRHPSQLHLPDGYELPPRHLPS